MADDIEREPVARVGVVCRRSLGTNVPSWFAGGSPRAGGTPGAAAGIGYRVHEAVHVGVPVGVPMGIPIGSPPRVAAPTCRVAAVLPLVSASWEVR